MALEDNFNAASSQASKQFSHSLLSKYGEKACWAAQELNSTDLTEDSLTTYKSQVRKAVSHLNSDQPRVEEVISFIQEADNDISTKRLMVAAMRKYYKAIDEYSKAEQLLLKAKDVGILNTLNNGEADIMEEEVREIFEYILPKSGEVSTIVGGEGKHWIMTLEHKALFATLYYTGKCVGEIIKLEKDDIYLEDQSIKVYNMNRHSEGFGREVISIPDHLSDILKEYIDKYEISSDNIFDYTTETIKNRILEIDSAYKYMLGEFKEVDKLTPHKLH